jgi:ubiquinone/menaquinone biosynthesis C-methylase UbiE
MKGRESGMPEERYWNSFFDADCVVRKLFGEKGCQGDVVEFGCGYGTFTFPAARHSTGNVFALDIEPDLIEIVRQKAGQKSVQNICASVRDFVAEGTGLESGSQSHAMIYNLLHVENPVKLLQEAHRVLHPGGILSVIHWRSDIPTPPRSLFRNPADPRTVESVDSKSGFSYHPGCEFAGLLPIPLWTRCASLKNTNSERGKT